MAANRALLGQAYYGDELTRLDEGGYFTRETLMRADARFRALTDEQWELIGRVLWEHFAPREGVFGGQITAGDGYFIGLFMAAMRPEAMIEVGVASGYSSGLILAFAEAFGLLKEGQVFLHSFDLMETHGNGGITGSFAREHYPHLMQYWALETQVTTATLDGQALAKRLPNGQVMAFLDGGHNHPWPSVDLCFLERHIPQCQWALMQDVQMMERWVSDAIVHEAPVPYPVRGVQFAVNHWPGRKLMGAGLSYNMAAVELRVGKQLPEFVRDIGPYPFEVDKGQSDTCRAYLDTFL